MDSRALVTSHPLNPSNDKQMTDCPYSSPFPGSGYLEETGIAAAAAAADEQEFPRYSCWVSLLSKARPLLFSGRIQS